MKSLVVKGLRNKDPTFLLPVNIKKIMVDARSLWQQEQSTAWAIHDTLKSELRSGALVWSAYPIWLAQFINNAKDTENTHEHLYKMDTMLVVGQRCLFG